jgi:hypothetical protein
MKTMEQIKQELTLSKKSRSIRTKLTIFVLALVLPISAVMATALN